MPHPLFRIAPHSGEPIYLQLIRQAKQAIAAGTLAPGVRLPSVRTLASSLVINPNTVARAYRELEQEGLLETSIGRGGSFVAARPPSLGAAEKRRRLQPHIDRLVSEARAIGVSDEELEGQLRKSLDRSPDSSGIR